MVLFVLIKKVDAAMALDRGVDDTVYRLLLPLLLLTLQGMST